MDVKEPGKETDVKEWLKRQEKMAANFAIHPTNTASQLTGRLETSRAASTIYFEGV